MNSSIVFSVLFVLARHALASNIGDTCANNGACTPEYSYCKKEYTNCDNGMCACNEGYEASSDSTSCLYKKTINAACTATDFCLYGTECDSTTSTCKCPSGETYNSYLKLCVTTGLKATGEECSAATNCYGYASPNSKVECIVNSGSSSTTKYCRCTSGHITESYMCREPHASEACTTAVGCTKQVDVGSGQEDETCVSDTCTCPSTSDKVTSTYQGTSYSLCYTKYSSKKAVSATCTQSNECSTYRCASCPGESTKKCLELAAGSVAQVASLGLLLAASVLTYVL